MPDAPYETRIFNYPGWLDNPYVRMLQAVAIERGFEPTGRTTFRDTLIELTSPERRGLVHIQWPTPVTEDAEDEADAERRVDLFLDALFTAKTLGRPILWTVHNVLPHDTAYRPQAVRLHRVLGKLADAIHVLSPHTVEHARHFYSIPPEKVVVIEHSSYDGVYGDPVPAAEARSAIGASADRTTVMFFGWIRPYKGIVDLSRATALAASRGANLEVLIAGRPLGPVQNALKSFDESGARITRHLKRVLDEDLPSWFGAADLLVLPYRRVLNSGTMHLAATYGVPVLLPNEPHLVEDYGDQAWIRFFDHDDPAESIAGLLADEWFLAPEARAAARAFADARPPRAMGEAYADLVTRLTERR
ncbi:glycosyltransferase [Microbacterium sp. ZXX196]|uniref:glycosyltransferase n=1 Tax=Microbacterium sp. ZXX196 TaxID=2609291 RepID=UPI0012B98DAC|nr:glycosyltransferase [Microbacterium sp. ZXX196]MTE22740.1 glycosyltransferase [Microbacterium sp. ZXX196]